MLELSLVSDLIDVTRQRGISNTFKILYSTLLDLFFDYQLGSYRTSGQANPQIPSAKLYRPSRGQVLSAFFKELPLKREGTFVDIGCGKGRALILAHQAGWNSVKGIDLCRDLVDQAKENLLKLQHDSPPLQWSVTVQNALEYEPLANESIFYLYDPFDVATTQKVAQNIMRQKKNQNQSAWIIYHHNFLQESLISHIFQGSKLKSIHEIRGNRFYLFSF